MTIGRMLEREAKLARSSMEELSVDGSGKVFTASRRTAVAVLCAFRRGRT